MKCLLIVAHGSRRESSNEEIAELTRTVAQRPLNTFDYVHYAFLEIAEPSISQGLNDCIEKGATHITVFPYFLAAGRHVLEDVPGEVESISQMMPGVEIEIKPHLGAADNIADVLLSCAN